MVIRGKCHKCGDRAFRVESDNIFRLALPWLSSFLQREVHYACTVCGEVRQWSSTLINLGDEHRPISLRSRSDHDLVNHKSVFITNSARGNDVINIQYPAVFRNGENVLFPTSEGNVQDATVIDRYGDPDLMAELAEEYLRQFRTLMPTRRLPENLKEIMPALLLLVTSTELAIKAFWIRDEKPLKPSHSLVGLYQGLSAEHKQGVERRFTEAESNLALSALGADSPKVTYILSLYSQTYGGNSNVYTDARYYAEPTTKLHGGTNLSKNLTPYPIFLPDIVQSLINTYWFFSGPNRIRRLGGDVLEGNREAGSDNHGNWGIIPASLGLVVVSVSQNAGKSAKGDDLRVYEAFKTSHPTGLTADWKYGGNTLLFYWDGMGEFSDGKQVIDGLECRIWHTRRMGLHPRDLSCLANILESASSGTDIIGRLTLRQ